MKPIRFAVFALCAATVCSTPKVQAETVVPQLQNVPQMQSAMIDLRNVKPSVMAFWLDPQRETSPDAKRFPLQVDPSLVVLPSGITNITASDKTNEISIRGSQQSVEKLRALIAFLDKPIPMIEVEMQMVQLPKTLMPSTATTKMASSNPDVEAFDGREIVKLIAVGKAKIVHAPRVTTFNKMQAMIVSMGSNTFFAPPLDAEGKSNRSITIGFGQKFSVTSTLNRDETFVLDLDCVDGFFLYKKDASPYAPGQTLPSPFNRTIQTVVNANSGQTIALRNVKEQDGKDSWLLLVKANLAPLSAK